MHEDFFTLGGIFALAGFVVEEFYCSWCLAGTELTCLVISCSHMEMIS